MRTVITQRHEKKHFHFRRVVLFFSFILVTMALLWALTGGSYLVRDQPQSADAILVLAGETDARPQRALELLRRGYSQRLILDVPNNASLFGATEVDLANRYVHTLPQAPQISICPIDGLSTKDESHDAEKCLQRESVKSVLIVTSDFHTRRALEIFQHELPSHSYSTAAARSPQQYGTRWWRHRQWAKTFLDESMKLVWWSLIDRWR